jgi:mannose-6-phosphate isomerase-like protein (cupin superfamily)
MSGDVKRSATGVSAGGQAVPEYFAKSVEFSVHQRECVGMAVEIASFASNGRGTGTSRKIERRQTLGVPMLKCVSRERNSFLQMSANFDLNHHRLAGDSKFATIASSLSTQSRIDSREAFNRYCRKACLLWSEHFSNGPVGTTARFSELLDRIKQRSEGTIQTPWGGVVIVLHEHPRVEKYLVIRRGGYLALEKHEQKDEHLEVKEGAGLILSRRAAGQPLTVEAISPGNQFHFEPGMEHCLIGTENLLVFERSVDPKGMDQDLVFIYEPDGPVS